MIERCTFSTNTARKLTLERKKLPDERRENGRMKICGFGDGSCRAIGCGVGMRVNVSTPALGWHFVNNQCHLRPKRTLWTPKSEVVVKVKY